MSYRPDLTDFDDVVGPISSTDNALVRFDGTTGKLLQDSSGAVISNNFCLTISGATVTASEPVLNLSQTWNNGAVTYEGAILDITPTAYDDNSKSFVLKRSGVPFMALDSWGTIGTGSLANNYWDSVPFAGWTHASTEGGIEAGYFTIDATIDQAPPGTDSSRAILEVQYSKATLDLSSSILARMGLEGPASSFVGLHASTNRTGFYTSGATRTSNTYPLLDLSETWNNAGVTFTGLKYNMTDTASAAASLLMDLQVGGVSLARVKKTGTPVFTGGVSSAGATLNGYVNDVSAFAFVATSTAFNAYGGTLTLGASADAVLSREAAATIQMGVDAATATAQRFKAHDGSGTDKDGARMTFSGGKSTGTGRGGDLATETSLTGTTGSSQNSYSTRLYQSAKEVALTESTATTIANVTVGSGKYVGIEALCTVSSGDGADGQSRTSRVLIDAHNKAGTVATAISQVDNNLAESNGASTLTAAYTAVANGNSIDIKVNAASSLTQTYLNCKWEFRINSNDIATVTAT